MGATRATVAGATMEGVVTAGMAKGGGALPYMETRRASASGGGASSRRHAAPLPIGAYSSTLTVLLHNQPLPMNAANLSGRKSRVSTRFDLKCFTKKPASPPMMKMMSESSSTRCKQIIFCSSTQCLMWLGSLSRACKREYQTTHQASGENGSECGHGRQNFRCKNQWQSTCIRAEHARVLEEGHIKVPGLRTFSLLGSTKRRSRFSPFFTRPSCRLARSRSSAVSAT